MSRALRELSNREKDLKVKQKLLEDALKIAELSLDLKHNNWAAHKWIGIILGDLKGLQGTKALLEVSPQIKVNQKSLDGPPPGSPRPYPIRTRTIWFIIWCENNRKTFPFEPLLDVTR